MWSSWILCGFLMASELAFPQGDTLNIPVLQMRKLRLGKGKSFDSIHRTCKRHNQNHICLILSNKTLCDDEKAVSKFKKTVWDIFESIRTREPDLRNTTHDIIIGKTVPFNVAQEQQKIRE